MTNDNDRKSGHFERATTGFDRRGLLSRSARAAAGMLIAQGAGQRGATRLCRGHDVKMKRTGEFNLGAREAAPPYGYKDRDGQWQGFATEIARAIHAAVQKDAGVPIKLNDIPVTPQTRIPLCCKTTRYRHSGRRDRHHARPRVKVVSWWYLSC